MFIYLSKKIAIPHNVPLRTLSWNTEQGWIACGGDNGLLKVLKLDNKPPRTKRTAKAGNAAKAPPPPPSNLSMNQTLEGHAGSVVCVTWNEGYRKLTSSDENGLIIVWMLHKGMWFEEMINNRNKSVVKDMKWTSDGSKICIVYEDGAVIVGSVDGNRLWGKELDVELRHVEWSPDGHNLLFGTQSNEVHCYDALGNLISKVNIYANNSASNSAIVTVAWYDGSNGYQQPHCPSLAIVFDNGRIQIGRDELDDAPVLIDTGMIVTAARWNHNGHILAIAGTKQAADSKDTAHVQFYTPQGKHLRTLKVPGAGDGVRSLTWEGGGLRLALAVDSFIYFANLRSDYAWGYFGRTLVYAFQKLDRVEQCVVFWDVTTDEKQVKYVKSLLSIKAAGDHCVFATRADDDSNQHILILCNAIGSPVDSKYIDIEPLYVTMTPYHIVVSNGDIVYCWQYSTPLSKLTTTGESALTSKQSVSMGGMKRRENRENSFHIDDPLSGLTSQPADNPSSQQHLIGQPSSSDPIVAITASKSILIVARASGSLLRFALPHLSLDGQYVLPCRAEKLALNCTSSRLSIIDINGICTLFDVDTTHFSTATPDASNPTSSSPSGQVLDFERKDAWDMVWADDNEELFAVMEKTRMYVFRGLLPEEPVQSSAFLCHFNELCIRAVQLDDLMADPEAPDKELILNFETKSLRDTRTLLLTTPITEATAFIEDNSHLRLWRLLAETALEQLNFTIADKAFVHCRDYQGIQFVKRLKLLNDKKKQKAEVCAYFRRFDEAEAILMEMEEKDQAVELRMRLGDWFRVVQLITVSGGGDDEMLSVAYDRIGDYYADRQKWNKAYKFYSKANNVSRMIECAYILDDYVTLTSLIDQTNPSSPYILSLAEKFQSVGLCAEAVAVYLKAEQPKAAIDCCVALNQWDDAMRLADEWKVDGVEGLLGSYALHLLGKEKWFSAVELYRKAGRHVDSARLLVDMAQREGRKQGKEVRVKKLYVMAAMEMERHKDKTIDSTSTADALKSLLSTDLPASSSSPTSTASLSSIWHGAEAYHFLLLCQRQLYTSQLSSALLTAQHLSLYDDVLPALSIHSLQCLTALAAGEYGLASRAFTRLESLTDVTADERTGYEQMAIEVFLRHSPSEGSLSGGMGGGVQCANVKCGAVVDVLSSVCGECGKDYGVCVVSGRSLCGLSGSELDFCRQCRHRAIALDWRRCTYCPLCHASIR